MSSAGLMTCLTGIVQQVKHMHYSHSHLSSVSSELQGSVEGHKWRVFVPDLLLVIITAIYIPVTIADIVLQLRAERKIYYDKMARQLKHTGAYACCVHTFAPAPCAAPHQARITHAVLHAPGWNCLLHMCQPVPVSGAVSNRLLSCMQVCTHALPAWCLSHQQHIAIALTHISKH